MKKCNKILEAVKRGINLALDNIEDDIQYQTHSKIKSMNTTKEYLDLMNIMVDLGLPSGTLWAKYNLGATSEFEYGDYYAWGEIKPKNEYNWDTYKYGYYKFENSDKLIKYNKNDNLTQLLLEDDAAYQNMHIHNFKFYIPTKEQCEELLEYTTNKWVNYKKSGVKGRLFTSKINGNSIFIPAAGFYSDAKINGLDTNGCIWSSTINSDTHKFNTQAYYINFYYFHDNNSNILDSSPRFDGYSIRPVYNL